MSKFKDLNIDTLLEAIEDTKKAVARGRKLIDDLGGPSSNPSLGDLVSSTATLLLRQESELQALEDELHRIQTQNHSRPGKGQ